LVWRCITLLSRVRYLRVPAGTFCFFFAASAHTEIYTLSLHDALPILKDFHRPSSPITLASWSWLIWLSFSLPPLWARRFRRSTCWLRFVSRSCAAALRRPSTACLRSRDPCSRSMRLLASCSAAL